MNVPKRWAVQYGADDGEEGAAIDLRGNNQLAIEEEAAESAVEESRRLRRLSVMKRLNALRNRGRSVFQYSQS